MSTLQESYTVNPIGESYKSSALVSQQYSMTDINDLALMISESLDDMQQQSHNKPSSSSKPGKPNKKCKNPGTCSKPGGKKPNKESMSQMQKELNKRIAQLKGQMNPFGNSQWKAAEN